MKNLDAYHIQQCPHCKNRSQDFLNINTEIGSSMLLHDSDTLHFQIHCEVCGASGPFGRTVDEALALWEYTHKINSKQDSLAIA